MKVLCKNCKTVYDTKDGKYEDHESSKCTWTDDDIKDYHYGFLSMTLMIGGLFVGFFIALTTTEYSYMLAIALPTFVLSQILNYKFWTKTTSQNSNKVKIE